MALSGCITFPIMHRLWRNRTIQWSIKDYSESNGEWDLQALGYTFSKSDLIG